MEQPGLTTELRNTAEATAAGILASARLDAERLKLLEKLRSA